MLNRSGQGHLPQRLSRHVRFKTAEDSTGTRGAEGVTWKRIGVGTSQDRAEGKKGVDHSPLCLAARL